jgi:DNA polymerase III epsilon subunit-like protein
LKIFFDTETTGLPEKRDAHPRQWKIFPRIVQFCWITTDDDCNIIDIHDYIIKPEDWIIPKEATNVHGITLEKAQSEGKPSIDVINLFLDDLDECKELIAHNLDFDRNVVASEMFRLGMNPIKKKRKLICTMLESTNFCKIPSKYGGYKWPKLEELYMFLFDKQLEGAHDAKIDVIATIDCFKELKKLKVI